MTDLTIGGESFTVLIGGDDTLPVLMLSNPLGADLHIWNAQMPELLKYFRIVRYNPRGYGSGVTDTGPYSIDRLGRDALAILDALGIQKAHWLGMSQGGAVGQWLLINAPDRIERAVLANTAAHFGSPEPWNERIVAAQEHGMEAMTDSVIERWFSADFAANHPERVEPVKQALLATSPEGYAAACAALRDLDFREGLLRIKHPVLVIAGSDDPSILPEQTALLAETIPGATLVTLQARHISAVEDAEAFTKAVVEFLTSKIPLRQTSPRKAAPPRSIARRPAGRRLPATRGATTDTLARRAAVKGVSATPKSVATPAAKTAPTSRPKSAAPSRKATVKTTRKGSVAAAPAKRAVAKSSRAKATSKTAAPKAATARKTRVAASPARTAKPTKTAVAKTPVAKTSARKAVAKAATPVRSKTTAPKRGAAKPAVVARKTTKAAAAKPTAARRAASKAPAKRILAAPAKSRTVTKAKTAPKAAAKTAGAKPAKAKTAVAKTAVSKPAKTKTARKPVTKVKAAPAKTKAAAKKTAAAKPATKATARKPAGKPAAKRDVTRRKA